MEKIKINKLEIENVKRVKAVKIEPTENGLTILGGDNNQGKTSVLDAIAWALGGNRFKPSEAKRYDSSVQPNLNIVLSNGLIVERKGKNSELKVTDPEGNKGGQQLLDTFVEELALDLPKFMQASTKEKANILLNIIGVGKELYELERKEKELYNERHAIGQIADRKKKFAEEQPYYEDMPAEPISAKDLIDEQQKILAKNGENQRKREQKEELERRKSDITAQINRLQSQLEEMEKEHQKVTRDLEIANMTVEQLVDESTDKLEKSIMQIDEMNMKIRANLDKEKAEEEAKEYIGQYEELTEKIAVVRKDRMKLLDNANLPLEGLSVEDNELIYNGFKWDNMSGSDQLKVATAIVRKLKPECGFVLLDKLEQMDLKTLDEFGKWLEEEGLQAIATRVSKGEECSIIIEDGYIKDEKHKEESNWSF